MFQKRDWFIADTDRALSTEILRDEPSHIHIQRPSKVARESAASQLWLEMQGEAPVVEGLMLVAEREAGNLDSFSFDKQECVGCR